MSIYYLEIILYNKIANNQIICWERKDELN